MPQAQLPHPLTQTPSRATPPIKAKSKDMDTTTRTNQIIADINLQVLEVIGKKLNLNIVDIALEHNQAASFIAAAIRKIVQDVEPKDEREPEEKTGE